VPFSTPVQKADVDFIRISDGKSVPLFGDITDAGGNFLVHVVPDVYDIVFRAPLQSFVEPKLMEDEEIVEETDLPNANLTLINSDGDQWKDVADNCPFVANLFQQDFDNDGLGDQCDNCPINNNPRQEDNDNDGQGDACDIDDDNDGLIDVIDNDRDGDGVGNTADNCINAWNPRQENADGDLDGDACDANDGIVEKIHADVGPVFVWRQESGAQSYQVYRQRLDWLSPLNYGVCSQDLPAYATLFHATEDPPVGVGFGYLVTGLNLLSQEGTLGTTSDGQPRANLRFCP
jgi:hypothetical protein